jgi:hypothetical protein
MSQVVVLIVGFVVGTLVAAAAMMFIMRSSMVVPEPARRGPRTEVNPR